jgi:hypothetical protein
MSSFNLKELLVDSLILGNIISHQKISFSDKVIETAALEKAMQLFKKLPSLGKEREQYTDKSTIPIEMPFLSGNTGHIPLIQTDGKEVAYIESVDIKTGGENFINNVDNVEKIIEKYEESNYNPELFIRTFIESENEIVELENIEYMIQKKQLILQKYHKKSKKIYEELNKIIEAIRLKIYHMEQSELIVHSEKILDIVKKSKEDSDSLSMFINNNQSYIVSCVYNEKQLRELIPIIRKLVDDKKIGRRVLESLLLPMNKK